MMFVTLGADTTLYHGSRRLYQLACNYARYETLLERYLTRSAFSLETNNLPTTFWSEVRRVVRAAKHPLYDVVAITKELLYMVVVGLLVDSGSTDVSVFSVLSEVIGDDYPGYQDILAFAHEVETTRNLDLFRVTFYSSMRLPVQFFSDSREVSERYAGEFGAVYEYTTTTPLTLLDYDDYETLVALADSVFTSTESYSQADLDYHTRGGSPAALRRGILRSVLQNFLLEDDILNLLDLCCQPVNVYDVITFEELMSTDDWSSLYELDLLSPAVLWRFATLDYGAFVPSEPGTTRLTVYDIDALLLKTLLADGRYQGYYSEAHQEYAIFYPSEHGQMNTLEVATDPERCLFVVEPPEDLG